MAIGLHKTYPTLLMPNLPNKTNLNCIVYLLDVIFEDAIKAKWRNNKLSFVSILTTTLFFSPTLFNANKSMEFKFIILQLINSVK